MHITSDTISRQLIELREFGQKKYIKQNNGWVYLGIGGRFKSRLPINYKLPVVFGLVVNFGDWKKLSLNFPLKSLTGNLKQMTESDWSTVFIEIKEIKGSVLC